MKTNVFFANALVIILCCSCKDTVCQDNAPADAEFSWTDYNTVKQVWDYFGCHYSTLHQHEGDTYKVCGHILLYEKETNQEFFESAFFRSMWNGGWITVSIGDDPNKRQGAQRELRLRGDTIVMHVVKDCIERDQKLYATIGCMGADYDDGDCCAVILSTTVAELKVNK